VKVEDATAHQIVQRTFENDRHAEFSTAGRTAPSSQFSIEEVKGC
jgi:hypothetical protein